MAAERKEQVIAVGIGSTGNGRSLTLNGRRQPSCGDTSRMNLRGSRTESVRAQGAIPWAYSALSHIAALMALQRGTDKAQKLLYSRAVSGWSST